MVNATSDERFNAILHLAVLDGGVRVGDTLVVKDCKTPCWSCAHARAVPGNCHILCAKPDPAMTGYRHGIEKGWFMYPLLFDPCWRTSECANFASVTVDSGAVNLAGQ